MRRTSGKNPMSIMRSASSNTSISMEERETTFCSSRSSRRPGVATTMSTPRRNASSWPRCETPPKIVQERSFAKRPSSCKAASTC